MFRFKTLLIVILAIVSLSLSAQKNAIKTSLSGAFLGDFCLIHESIINKSSSVQLKIGYLKPTMSPFIDEKTITPEALTLQDAKGGLNTSVEYRFYVSRTKEAPNGFYIAPYLRFFNQSAMFTDEIDKNIFNVDAKLNTIGAGAQLGYQFLIADVITLDFYFFGAGVDKHFLKMKYELKSPNAEFAGYNSITDDVSEVFEDINYLEERLEHDVSKDNLTSKLPFLFPGFRMGISVGVAF